jgi:SynChlorMet cassette protein ScmC
LTLRRPFDPEADFLELFRLLGQNPPPSLPRRGYRLALADGSRWWLSGMGHTAPWVERLAVIMRLSPGERDGASVLLFTGGLTPPWPFSPPPVLPGWEVLEQRQLRGWFRPGSPHTLVELPFKEAEWVYIGLWSALTFIYQDSLRRGGLPLHGALVSREGRAVSLVAPGETGKSTCCRRLFPPWRSLCDDEHLVVLSPEGRYLAHPFPTWSDYLFERGEFTWDVQEAVPLAGVCFLEQAPEDSIEPMGQARGAVALYESGLETRYKLWLSPSHRGEDIYRRFTFNNAASLATRLPTFRLRVSLTGRFWELLETALGWR